MECIGCRSCKGDSLLFTRAPSSSSPKDDFEIDATNPRPAGNEDVEELGNYLKARSMYVRTCLPYSSNEEAGPHLVAKPNET